MLIAVATADIYETRLRNHLLVRRVFVTNVEHSDTETGLDDRYCRVHGARAGPDNYDIKRGHPKRRANTRSGIPIAAFIAARVACQLRTASSPTLDKSRGR